MAEIPQNFAPEEPKAPEGPAEAGLLGKSLLSGAVEAAPTAPEPPPVAVTEPAALPTLPAEPAPGGNGTAKAPDQGFKVDLYSLPSYQGTTLQQPESAQNYDLVRRAMDLSAGHSPQDSAAALEMSRRTGIDPMSILERSELLNLARHPPPDLENLRRLAPATTGYVLGHPEVLTAISPDLGLWGNMERELAGIKKHVSQQWNAAWANIEMAKLIEELRAQGPTPDIMRRYREIEQRQSVGQDWQGPLAWFLGGGASILPSYLYAGKEALVKGAYGALAGAGLGLLVGGPEGAAAGARLGGKMGAIYGGFTASMMLEGNLAYQQALQEGLSFQEAEAVRSIIGPVNAALEFGELAVFFSFGVGKMVQRAVRRALTRKAIEWVIKKRGRIVAGAVASNYLKAWLTETVQEGAQAGVSKFVMEMTKELKKDKTFWDSLGPAGEKALVAGLQEFVQTAPGMATIGLLGLPGAVVGGHMTINRARVQAQINQAKTQAYVDAVTKATRQMEAAKTTPETVERVTRNLAKQYDMPAALHIGAEELRDFYLQSPEVAQRLPLDSLLSALNVEPEKFNYALSLGLDVQFDSAKLVHLQDPAFDSLRAQLRSEPLTFTPEEAERLLRQDQAPLPLKAMEAFRQQLLAAGVPEEQAELHALIWARRARVIANIESQRTGQQVSPEEVLGGIAGPTVQYEVRRARVVEEARKAAEGPPGRPVQPTTARKPTLTAPREPLGAPKQQGQPFPSRIEEIDIDRLTLAPDVFQYKRSVGEGGVSKKLKAVKKYDPELAGILSVWQDPKSGTIYVVNGHHRYELAIRTGQKKVVVRYLNAKTAAEVRLKGALINIAEGQGTSEDAAILFREEGLTEKALGQLGISLRGKVAREGIALARLHPAIFKDIQLGKFPREWGVIIGENLPDHDAQIELVKLIEREQKKGKRISAGIVAGLVHDIKNAPTTTQEETSLFGKEVFKRPLAIERAQLIDYAAQKLAADKRLFGTVGDEARAARLAEELPDTSIDVAASREISQEAAIIREILLEKTGLVDTILNKHAEALSNAANRQEANRVKQEFVEELRGAIPQIVRGRAASEYQGNRADDSGGQPTGAARDLTKPGTLFQSPAGRIFYIKASEAADAALSDSATGHAHAQALRALARKGEISQADLEWSGVLEWLYEQDRGARVSKAQVLEFLRGNQLQVDEALGIGGDFRVQGEFAAILRDAQGQEVGRLRLQQTPARELVVLEAQMPDQAAAARRMLRWTAETGRNAMLWEAADAQTLAHLRRFVKKWNGTVKELTDGQERLWRMDVTPAMRQSALYQAEGEGPKGAFDPELWDRERKALVALFEGKADASTLIHETGHIWRRELRWLAQQEGASLQTKQDWITILKWLGVEPEKGAKEADLVLSEAQEEKFAKGLERYFMEGRAPTPDLASAFQRFKAWLLDIYQTFTGLGVSLNDEVRAVFDRMLATEEELAAVRAEMDMTPLQAGVNQDLAALAWAKAEEQIKTERINSWKVARKAWIKEARDLADNTPAHRFMAEVAEAGGLNYDELKNWLSPTKANAVRAKFTRAITRQGKLTVMEAAGLVGQEPADLMDLLTAAPSRKELTEQHLAKREAQFNAEAQDAYELAVSEAYLDFMAAEAAALVSEETTGPAKIAAHQIKSIVRRETGQKTVNEAMVPEGAALKAGMKKAERAARKAFTAGRREEAAVQKQRQLALAARIREQARTRREIDGIKRFINTLRRIKPKRPGVKGGLAHEYLALIHSILEGLGQQYAPYQRIVATFNAQEVLQRARENGELPTFDPEVLNLTQQKRFGELAVDELRQVETALKELKTLGYQQSKLISFQEQKDILQVAGEMQVRTAETHKKARLAPEVFGPKGTLATIKDKAAEWARSFVASLTKLEFLFNALDGHPGVGEALQGPWHRYMYQPLEAAQNRELEISADVALKLKAAWDIFSDKEKAAMGKALDIPGVPITVTLEQALAILLNSGNEGNLKALHQGYAPFGWQAEYTKAVQMWAGRKHWRFVQEVWNTINGLFPLLNEAHKKLNGVNLKKVEGMPIQTRFGVIQGQYYPIKLDYQLSLRGAEIDAAALAKDMFNAYSPHPKVRAGAVHERTGTGQPVKLSLRVIEQHVAEVTHYATHAPAHRDVVKLANNQQVHDTIRKYYGEQYYNQIRPWLLYVAQGMNERRNETTTVLARARRNTTLVALGVKLTVAMLQTLSLTQTVEAIGIGQTLKGFGEFMTGGPWAKVAEVQAKSTFMANRNSRIDRDLQSEATWAMLSRGEKTRETINKVGFFLIRQMDAVASYSSWLAAYDQALKQGKSEQQAVRQADYVVRTTQPVFSSTDMANWTTRGEFYRALSMFYSFFSVFANRMFNVNRSLRQGQTTILSALRSYWLLWVLPAALAHLIRSDSEDWDDPAEWAKAIAAYWFAMFPVVRDVAGIFLNPYEYALSPLADVGKALYRLKGTFSPLWSGKPQKFKAKKAAQRSLELGGYIFGLPGRQASITFGGAWDLATGEMRPDDPEAWRNLALPPKRKKKGRVRP